MIVICKIEESCLNSLRDPGNKATTYQKWDIGLENCELVKNARRFVK